MRAHIDTLELEFYEECQEIIFGMKMRSCNTEPKRIKWGFAKIAKFILYEYIIEMSNKFVKDRRSWTILKAILNTKIAILS